MLHYSVRILINIDLKTAPYIDNVFISLQLYLSNPYMCEKFCGMIIDWFFCRKGHHDTCIGVADLGNLGSGDFEL